MSTIADEPDDEMEPQDLAAADFMTHKGLGFVDPSDVEVLEPGLQWMYYYDLPDGSELDLRITWVAGDQDWDTFVVDFRKPPRP